MTEKGRRDSFVRDVLAFGAAASYGTLGRLLVYGIFAALVCGNDWIGHHTINQEVGLAPFEAGGAVLGLMLVLRTNAGYERWWEGSSHRSSWSC
jgi:putative membrane protein